MGAGRIIVEAARVKKNVDKDDRESGEREERGKMYETANGEMDCSFVLRHSN